VNATTDKMTMKLSIWLTLIALISLYIVADGQDDIAIFQTSSPDVTGSPYEWKYDNAGRSVQQTTDSGYIIAGYTKASGSADYNMLLIKTDSSGSLEWKNTFGGSDEDRGMDVKQTSDGGYIIVGYTKSKGSGVEDIWLVKTNKNGEEIWDKTFGGINDDRGLSIDLTMDGGFIIAGITSSFGAGNYDAWIIKTDSHGNKVWERIFGGRGSDGGVSILTDRDEGFILTGWTEHYNSSDKNVFIVRIDSRGNEIWEKSLGELGNCEGNSIWQTADRGYIISGCVRVKGNAKMDVLLVKTDLEGKIEWYKTFGGIGWDDGYFAFQTSDNGFIILGDKSKAGSNNGEMWMIKTNSNGQESWNKTFGENYNGEISSEAFSGLQVEDEGFVAVGAISTNRDSYNVCLFKTDRLGNVEWHKTFGGIDAAGGVDVF
jgi:hypothetical protein